MRIGYACITLGDEEIKYKNFRIENIDKKAKEIIEWNISALNKAIEYNGNNGIHMFRITSDLIPFASHSDMKFDWKGEFKERFHDIGMNIQKYDIRVSMHPGQYTVINSKNEEVVKKSIKELEYHLDVLKMLETKESSKIILHIGGVYGNKKDALERFINNYKRLSDELKDRIVIENDDSRYNIKDVLYISNRCGAPVVFDNLHHSINPPDVIKSEEYWIEMCSKTWHTKDGIQKIHYSQQDKGKRKGAHSATIFTGEFKSFIDKIKDMDDLDIMLEVKDKNLSAIKCKNLIDEFGKIKALEEEWGRYKYLVLEKSPAAYNAIRNHLKDKESYDPWKFYELIEGALSKEEDKGHTINGMEHVWGYFKKNASNKEKDRFIELVKEYNKGNIDSKKIKMYLKKLNLKYKDSYLEKSYYINLL